MNFMSCYEVIVHRSVKCLVNRETRPLRNNRVTLLFIIVVDVCMYV
jgi:hypothetical protein